MKGEWTTTDKMIAKSHQMATKRLWLIEVVLLSKDKTDSEKFEMVNKIIFSAQRSGQYLVENNLDECEYTIELTKEVFLKFPLILGK